MNEETIILTALKPFLPKLKKYLAEGGKELKNYIGSIPLQEGETHIAVFTEIDNETVYAVTGAFCDKTFVRFIEAKPLAEWISQLIEKALKNGNGR